MVRPTGAPVATGSLTELPEPTWRLLLSRGLPTFALEGVLPVLVFYGVWRSAGLAPGVIASSATAGLIVLWQLRRGVDVVLAGVWSLWHARRAFND